MSYFCASVRYLIDGLTFYTKSLSVLGFFETLNMLWGRKVFCYKSVHKFEKILKLWTSIIFIAIIRYTYCIGYLLIWNYPLYDIKYNQIMMQI
jgi:hypothetical protein